MYKYQAALMQANTRDSEAAAEPPDRRWPSPFSGEKGTVAPGDSTTRSPAAPTGTTRPPGARVARHLMARPMMILPCAPEQAPPSPSTTSPSTTGAEEWSSPESSPPSSAAAAVPVPTPAAVRDSNLDKGSAVVARRLRQAPLKAFNNSFRAMVELGFEDDTQEEMRAAASTDAAAVAAADGFSAAAGSLSGDRNNGPCASRRTFLLIFPSKYSIENICSSRSSLWLERHLYAFHYSSCHPHAKHLALIVVM